MVKTTETMEGGYILNMNINMNNEIKFQDVLNEMLDIYEKKNADYGNSYSRQLDEFGIVAGVVRMSDKMERLKNLSKGNEAKVKDESVYDTLLDLANYSAMTCMWLRNKILEDGCVNK